MKVDSARAFATCGGGSCDSITPVSGVNISTNPVPRTICGIARNPKVESVLYRARIHMTMAMIRKPAVPAIRGSIRVMYLPIVRLSRIGAIPTGASTSPAQVAV